MRLIELGLERLNELLRAEWQLVNESFNIIEECLSGGNCETYKAYKKSSRLLELHEEVKELAVEIIARYQPIAGDLRFIVSTMEVSYDLYRITRYLAEIERLMRISKISDQCKLSKCLQVLDMVKRMVELSINAFLGKNIGAAKEVMNMDNDVDKNYVDSVKRIAEKSSVSNCEALGLLVIRHFERIADHATYIAGAAIYVVTGERPHTTP